MKKVFNECCNCATPNYPCRGASCPNRAVTRYFCDKCKKEAEQLYHYDGQEMCLDCIEEDLEKVE